MKSNESYKSTAVTVLPQIEQARACGRKALTVTLPEITTSQRVAYFGAFAEWGSELDRAYDVLADEAP